MRLSALFSFAALIAVAVAAGTTPVEDSEALADSAVYNQIEPHFGSTLSPRDDPANIEFVSLLEKRQSCPKGTGLCSNDRKRCCPLGGRCCSKGGCCGKGRFCVGKGCCPNTQNGCDNKGCCPKKWNCCKGGACCKPGTYCVRRKNGSIGCCPNGKLCRA
ncbi:hypothetical protein BGZ70_009463 [Mortierella alpina]|uniref:Uncharacterized protein n=1 Tax=Mortierella alpina TaxID=64518 RepID=A0A9P6J1A6_MORAP|nr:hypothetical protein BGZ70_009463 [Mortierella alpina]